MASKKDEKYLIEARRLAARFPKLKRFRRRKRLNGRERQEIGTARYYADIADLSKDQRPERLRNYKVPARRFKSEKEYAFEARSLARVNENFEKYKGLKKFTPAQKAAITRAYRPLIYSSEKIKITRAQANKLPDEMFPMNKRGQAVRSTRLVRLANTSSDRKIISVSKNGSMIVRSGGRRWKYVYTGADVAAIANAADKAFQEGAQRIYFWTSMGRTSEGLRSVSNVIYEQNRYREEYLDPEDWFIGIAYTLDP